MSAVARRAKADACHHDSHKSGEIGTACEEHVFAHTAEAPSPLLFGELVLAVMAADEDQEAGDQRQDGEHEQAA